MIFLFSFFFPLHLFSPLLAREVPGSPSPPPRPAGALFPSLFSIPFSPSFPSFCSPYLFIQPHPIPHPIPHPFSCPFSHFFSIIPFTPSFSPSLFSHPVPHPFFHPFSPIPFSPSLSPSLLFAAGGQPLPAPLHPRGRPSAPSRCLSLVEARPYWRHRCPPQGPRGGPWLTSWGAPSLFTALHPDPRLQEGARRSRESSSGSRGRLFAPPQGCCRYLGAALPSCASVPAAADAARSPSGCAVPIKLFRCGFPHPLLCSWRFLALLFLPAEAGPPPSTRAQNQVGDKY